MQPSEAHESWARAQELMVNQLRQQQHYMLTLQELINRNDEASGRPPLCMLVHRAVPL